MFMVTAKLDKRMVIGGGLALVGLIAAAVLIFGGKGGGDRAAGAAELSATVKTNEQRVKFLEDLGWEVSPEPVEEQAVTIPKDFSKVYEDYNELQMAQGFDLRKYSGFDATRYTYEVTNHPTAEGRVVADIIVYRNRVIAGDVQSPTPSGFMAPMAFPET